MNGSLKKINANDISKIASGQVIVDLRSVIKELVENSLVFLFLDCLFVGCRCYECRYTFGELRC